MNRMEKLKDLLDRAEKISEIEKCKTCQCFCDALMEFKKVLESEENGGDATEARLSGIIDSAMVSHGCLGCDPCYPVPISNALSEMTESHYLPSSKAVCQPRPLQIKGKDALSWPIEQGEYIIGNTMSPVSISTLGSDEMAGEIARKLDRKSFALVGKTHTENIGIEKVVKNAISNSFIRFVILSGIDTRGHRAGQSLLSLKENGANAEKKIIGSKGQRPVLKNLTFPQIQQFREQVELVDLMGTEDLRRIEEEVNRCIKENPGALDGSLVVTRAPMIEAKPSGRLVLDPSGFFIIYLRKDDCTIYLEHYKADGTLNEVVYGTDSATIASAAIDRGLVSRLDHATYLGRELEKAFLSMLHGFQYVQDKAPGKEEANCGGNCKGE